MNNPPNSPSSAMPAFMKKAEEEVSEVKSKPVDYSNLGPLAAVVVKSTGRLEEMANYTDIIEKSLSETLPRFIAENPLGECVDLYVDLEARVEAFEDALKRVKAQISLSREVHFPTRFDNEQTKTHTSASGIRMSRTSRVLASIIPGKQETAFEWLRGNNYGSLIKETVNSSSLCSAAKELIENGSELPDEIFNVHLKDGVSITKPRARKA